MKGVMVPYKIIAELSMSANTIGQIRRRETVDTLRILYVSQDGAETEVTGDRRKLAIYRLMDVINHNESVMNKKEDVITRKISPERMDEIISKSLNLSSEGEDE